MALKLPEVKTLVLLSHDKLLDWYIAFVPFPIKIWLLFNVVVPIPPKETGNVPDVTFDAFKLLFNA